MSKTLQNLKHLSVLITKPKNQALDLIAAIEKLGGKAISLPMIEINDAIPDQALLKTIRNLVDFDIAIFVSPNAVDKTTAIFSELSIQWPSSVKIAAIGSATAKKLTEQHLSAHIVPTEKFDSEALLDQPELKNCAGKKIVIFQGNDGRELLKSTLETRGAKLTQAIVYQRVVPEFSNDNEVTETIFDQNDINVIICTSNTSLQNLYELTNPTYRLKLQSMRLLVGSIRQVNLAKALGFRGDIIVAKNATDDALINELKTLK